MARRSGICPGANLGHHSDGGGHAGEWVLVRAQRSPAAFAADPGYFGPERTSAKGPLSWTLRQVPLRAAAEMLRVWKRPGHSGAQIRDRIVAPPIVSRGAGARDRRQTHDGPVALPGSNKRGLALI